jgi:hypothetical protein
LNVKTEQKKIVSFALQRDRVNLFHFNALFYPHVKQALMQYLSSDRFAFSIALSPLSNERAIKSRLQERRINSDD